ncbi:MAG: hypothetical protein D6754_03115 [Alphaproteobacteria bacterium]|nr:MAG: hypothetical protein D6754_03115 [Alphaproteobacteria bacterium]
MSDQLVFDVVRLGHLVGLALGLGLAIYADSRFLGTITRPVSGHRLLELRRIHRFVAASLVLLWLSGLTLLVLRTGLDPAKISPKLIAKLLVVGLLTANAFVIGRMALPLLSFAEGLIFHELPLIWRLRLGVTGAVSAGSWISATLLGTVGAFKAMGAAQLAQWGAAVMGGALAAGLALALLSPVLRLGIFHRWEEKLAPAGAV